MMPVHNLTQGMDYGTIQAAIDAAVANDVILCDAGSYTENINIHTPITLRGPNVNPRNRCAYARSNSVELYHRC
ncbi:MAG: hypothetical protein IPG87_18250 [Saprospiraceae bacterium]|nr:hypothetical protein [Candidatus Vicinibacter affinis]